MPIKKLVQMPMFNKGDLFHQHRLDRNVLNKRLIKTFTGDKKRDNQMGKTAKERKKKQIWTLKKY